MLYTQLAFAVLAALAWQDQTERLQYLRPAGDGYQRETEIRIRQQADQRIVTSTTTRGTTVLSLTSRFDRQARLLDARVQLGTGGMLAAAGAERQGSRVRVSRADGTIDWLDCPSPLIVTSAPDWTDAVMMMRQYDARQGGGQEFAGLWIHPRRQPLRITFRVEPLGQNEIRRDGSPQTLDRFLLVLRNNSQYVGWRNEQRQLVRLVPAASSRAAIVLAGWERATSQLMP